MPVSAIFGRKVIQQLETFKEIPQEQYDRDRMFHTDFEIDMERVLRECDATGWCGVGRCAALGSRSQSS